MFFAPKYRRQIIYGKYKASIGQILRLLCERKGVEIHEAEACPDHIHMLVSIPPKLSISSFMGYLKGKSSLMIFDRHANLKYKYGNRKFLVSRLLCWYGWAKSIDEASPLIHFFYKFHFKFFWIGTFFLFSLWILKTHIFL